MGFKFNPFTGNLDLTGSSAAAGTVTSSSVSSTDNSLVRFDGISGTVVQNSSTILQDDGTLILAGEIIGNTLHSADKTDASASDDVNIYSGQTVSGTGDSGSVYIEVGQVSGNRNPGTLHIDGGNAENSNGGNIQISSGQSANANFGDVIINVGTGNLNLLGHSLNLDTVPYLDINNNLISSAVTSTELGFVHNVTSAIQTQLNGKQATGNYITALTGDVTASGPGSVAATLVTVNSNVGSFGAADQVSSITVNAKGLITAASNTAIQITESQVTNLTTDLAAKQSNVLTNAHILVGSAGNIATDVAVSGDVSIANTGAVTLATVNGNVGSFGTAANVGSFTVNAKGLVTAASNTAIQIAESQVTNLVSDLAATEKTANKGIAGGYASLDGGGKVPVAQLPNSIMEFQGNWDASTNTPTLADGTGNTGDVYRANVAGTQNLGSGAQTFVVGDWVMYNGSIWQLAHAGADAVLSVNGAAGVVTVNAINQLTGDITAGPASGSQSQAATLATVNGNVGSFGSVSQVAGFTVNAKGLVTAASNTSIQITESQVTNLTSDLAAKQSTALTSAHILVGNGSNLAADVAVSGDLSLANTGAFTIANSAVSNAKMANMAAHTYKGNNTGSSSAPIDVTSTQLTADLDLFTSSLQGLVPASGGGSTNFLRADGTFAIPSGTGINQLTGDATAGPGSGSQALTLATVNGNVGSFGSATQSSTFTVNAKGLITAASNTAIQITESQVTNLVSDLAAKQSNTLTSAHILVGNGSNVATDVALSGDASLSNTGALTLATVNGNVGSFGTASSVGSVTVNAKGLVTAASNTAIQITESQVTNLTTDLAGKLGKSTGDIDETSFTGLVNNTANQVVTGFAFANGTVRSFQALCSVFITATSNTFTNFRVEGIQRGADWVITSSSVGDVITGFAFDITTAGQVRISLGNIAGFSTSKVSFRAITTTV